MGGRDELSFGRRCGRHECVSATGALSLGWRMAPRGSRPAGGERQFVFAGKSKTARRQAGPVRPDWRDRERLCVDAAFGAWRAGGPMAQQHWRAARSIKRVFAHWANWGTAHSLCCVQRAEVRVRVGKQSALCHCASAYSLRDAVQRTVRVRPMARETLVIHSTSNPMDCLLNGFQLERAPQYVASTRRH